MTDVWKEREVKERDYGLPTDGITKTWSGKTTGKYRVFKRLDPKKKESLRASMTPALDTLAEASTAASPVRRISIDQATLEMGRLKSHVVLSLTSFNRKGR